MIRFLLTSWWFYIPIIAVLIFLTRRNNQKIKEIKASRTDSVDNAAPAHKPKKQSARVKKAANKLGLSGAASHIRHKK